MPHSPAPTADLTSGRAFTITEVPIPASLDAPGGEDFRRMVEVRNLIEADAMGTTDLQPTAELLISNWNNPFEPKRLWLARIGGDIVGRALYEWQPEGPARIAFLTVEVLPTARRRGIGTALLSAIEEASRADGRYIFQAWAQHGTAAGDHPLTPPTGFGRIDRRRPEVQFLLRNGYALEQIERASKLTLPVVSPSLQERYDLAAGKADGYRVETWAGAVPDRWVDDLAYLHSRMVTDVPSGALEFEDEDWNADRVRQIHRGVEAGGCRLLSVAAFAPDGRPVGYSDLVVQADPTRPASQEDTLVLTEHRGHRLGTLLKIANLQQLESISPQTRAVTTFNAEENRPMLDVNEAVGFRPIGYEGAWKKTLPPPEPAGGR